VSRCQAFLSAWVVASWLGASVVFAAPLPITPGSWTLAVLPDTQNYAESYPATFNAQTRFLADYRNTLNLGFVLHEGDVTDDNLIPQWENASAAMQILDSAGVGYALAPGNHDLGPDGYTADRTSYMADCFPVSRLAAQPTFGGVYPGVDNREINSPQNNYSLYSAGGTDWVALALEFGPRNEVVDWADGVLKAHPDRQAMIVTHAYLYSDDTRYDWAAKGTAQEWNPYSYGIANQTGGVNDGEDLWRKLKNNPNVKFIFSGHVLNDGTGYLASVADHGNVVHQMLANYQFLPNGGQGYLRLLEFLPDNETVHVRTYSPVLDSYLTAPDQDFIISLNTMPAKYNACLANLLLTGPTLGDITVANVSVPQSGNPAIGVLRADRGDIQIAVGGMGVKFTDGVLLAGVRQNLRDGVRATVETGRNNYGDGYMTLSVAQAGVSPINEANFNVAAAWFRFDGGWQGAQLNGDDTLAAANGITQNMITHVANGRSKLNLGPGAASQGMLFAIGNNNTNIIVQTGVLDDGRWDIRRQNNKADFSAIGPNFPYSLLYLPLDTQNLIGGRYDGLTATNVLSAGDFTMLNLGAGQYQLTIPGESPETGMLILTIAKETAIGGVTAPDDNFLTYEADAEGRFIINSLDLTGSNNLNFEDTEFVWAFISFTHPITMQPVPEPSALVLIGSGLVGLLWALDRQRRRSSLRRLTKFSKKICRALMWLR
jgi:hypothetical protein